MARSRARTAKKKTARVDFSKVSKQFEGDMEYAIRVAECTLEEGNEYPYFSLKLSGADEEYENSVMYHNASTSPQSLWRLRPLVEALGIEIPEGEMDLEPEDFVDRTCMCSTVLDKKPAGGTRVIPDDFWPMDEADEKPAKKAADKKSTSKKSDDPTVEDLLENLDDSDIKALGKEFQISSRKVDDIKEELAAVELTEFQDACKDLDIELEAADEKEEEKPARGRRKAADDEDEKPARSRRSAKKDDEEEEKPAGRRTRSATKDEDEDDDKGKSSRSARGSGKSSKKPTLTEDEVDEMNEDELDDIVSQYELDVDLEGQRTLRKKKSVVKDALEEAGFLK